MTTESINHNNSFTRFLASNGESVRVRGSIMGGQGCHWSQLSRSYRMSQSDATYVCTHIFYGGTEMNNTTIGPDTRQGSSSSLSQGRSEDPTSTSRNGTVSRKTTWRVWLGPYQNRTRFRRRALSDWVRSVWSHLT